MAPEGSWTEEMSGRQRVRATVETLDGPATIQEIADRAEVSRTTAADELERLAADNLVQATIVDDKKGYDLNPSKLFFDELLELIEENSRTELEETLEGLHAEREDLRDEFGADSLSAFRERLTDGDRPVEELREIRNVVATWEALNHEITLVEHALRLYDDVTQLSGGEPTGTPVFS